MLVPGTGARAGLDVRLDSQTTVKGGGWVQGKRCPRWTGRHGNAVLFRGLNHLIEVRSEVVHCEANRAGMRTEEEMQKEPSRKSLWIVLLKVWPTSRAALQTVHS